MVLLLQSSLSSCVVRKACKQGEDFKLPVSNRLIASQFEIDLQRYLTLCSQVLGKVRSENMADDSFLPEIAVAYFEDLKNSGQTLNILVIDW